MTNQQIAATMTETIRDLCAALRVAQDEKDEGACYFLELRVKEWQDRRAVVEGLSD